MFSGSECFWFENARFGSGLHLMGVRGLNRNGMNGILNWHYRTRVDRWGIVMGEDGW